jgi:hypothetical protein
LPAAWRTIYELTMLRMIRLTMAFHSAGSIQGCRAETPANAQHPGDCDRSGADVAAIAEDGAGHRAGLRTTTQGDVRVQAEKMKAQTVAQIEALLKSYATMVMAAAKGEKAELDV